MNCTLLCLIAFCFLFHRVKGSYYSPGRETLAVQIIIITILPCCIHIKERMTFPNKTYKSSLQALRRYYLHTTLINFLVVDILQIISYHCRKRMKSDKMTSELNPVDISVNKSGWGGQVVVVLGLVEKEADIIDMVSKSSAEGSSSGSPNSALSLFKLSAVFCCVHVEDRW